MVYDNTERADKDEKTRAEIRGGSKVTKILYLRGCCRLQNNLLAGVLQVVASSGTNNFLDRSKGFDKMRSEVKNTEVEEDETLK